MNYEVQFSNPVDYAGNPASKSTPFQFQNALITATDTGATSSTSTIKTIEGFTYGEIVISTFLILIFLVQLFRAMWELWIGIKIKRVGV